MILADGTTIAAKIISASDSEIVYARSDAKAQTLPLSRVAVVLFAAFPRSSRKVLDRDTPGLLLRNGDYIEGSIKSVDRTQVTISSVVFGNKSFIAGPQAVALVLRRPPDQKKK